MASLKELLTERNETLARQIEDLTTKMETMQTALHANSRGQPRDQQAPASSTPAPAPAVTAPPMSVLSFFASDGYWPAVVPKFNGDEAQYPMWRTKTAVTLLQAGCRSAIEPTGNPVRVGDESLVKSDLNALHSAEVIRKATLAWSI